MTRTTEARRRLAAEIRRLDALGVNGKDISSRLGCSSGHVSKVLSRSRMAIVGMQGLHVTSQKWTAKASPATCQEWVRTPDGLRPCGADKHKLAGERMGQCREHYEAQRPMAGKMRGVS